uniref:Uncharacterized protein n=1 Tax=Setaria italica TaxID=4555 RepID=K3ZB06_SETIT
MMEWTRMDTALVCRLPKSTKWQRPGSWNSSPGERSTNSTTAITTGPQSDILTPPSSSFACLLACFFFFFFADDASLLSLVFLASTCWTIQPDGRRIYRSLLASISS